MQEAQLPQTSLIMPRRDNWMNQNQAPNIHWRQQETGIKMNILLTRKSKYLMIIGDN